MDLKAFIDYIKYEKRFSKHTITAYRNDICQFSDYIEETFEVLNEKEVSRQMIRSWIAALVENKQAAKTIKRKISALKSYYKFLLKNGKVLQNPLQHIITPKIEKKLPVFVEEEKMKTLFDLDVFSEDFFGQRDRFVVECLYQTGMRLSEIIQIKEKDVDFNRQEVKVLGKRNKERIIPLTKHFLDFVEYYMKIKNNYFRERDIQNTEYLLVTNQGLKAYPKLIYRITNKYIEKVSTLSKKSPHVLRHTFATHLLNNGADINAIKEILGHANLSATQVYTHTTIDKLKHIYEQAHPRA